MRFERSVQWLRRFVGRKTAASAYRIGNGASHRPMRKIDPQGFIGQQAWQALHIDTIEGATVRLHWTDRPYRWHVNDGAEVFVPLDGSVTMRYRRNGQEHALLLNPGDICHAEVGDEHVAEPHGAVRILVIEKAGSV